MTDNWCENRMTEIENIIADARASQKRLSVVGEISLAVFIVFFITTILIWFVL